MRSFMLEQIILKGYKSFRELDLSLAPVNVLIGANGAGKSNFIGIFQMLHRMMNGDLQHHIARSGGANQILHYGSKMTRELYISLWFLKKGDDYLNGYTCRLKPAEDRLMITEEATYFHDRSRYAEPYRDQIHVGLYQESLLPQWAKKKKSVSNHVYQALHSWEVYHFHDTAETARMKQIGDINENRRLLADAGNLAAYLYFLCQKYPQHYQNIVETVRLAAPFFGDFSLRPNPYDSEKIRLEWRERGSDLTFGPNALSDGTLRFICLATLFLQPVEKLPATILLDEPELGLHPYAIRLFADMVYSVAAHTQVIVATQSLSLINHFSPQDILVVDRADGVSTIRRLESAEMEHWLEDYSLGELWEKNVFGGVPTS